MSGKRTKQYLMLLMVIGLVSIAAGGGGTFASFSAETTNAGNSFATGTLVLNDNGGVNTCTSAIGSTSVTPADSNNKNTAGTDCDTLFSLKKFTQPTGTTTATLTANVTVSVAYTGLSAPIYKGDSVTISGGGNTENVTVATSSTTSTGAGTFTVSVAPTHTYASGATLTDNNPTYFASLTLTNAGSIDANGIKFKAGNPACTSKYTEGHGTLNMAANPVVVGTSSGVTLTVAGAGITATSFPSGSPVVVVEGGHAQTFISGGQADATHVTVTAQNWNFAFTHAAIVSGPEFNGATAQALCGSLKLAIVETASTFDQDMSTALGCAYGSITAVVATNSCDLAASTALSSLSNSFTSLGIATTGGDGDNTSGLLNAGKNRYFLLAVHYTGGSFDNTFQNTSAAGLDLTWHIDQA